MEEKHVFNLQKDIEDNRDYKYSSVVEAEEKLPRFVSHRDKFTFTFNQGALGSCTSNAFVMNVLHLNNFEIPVLSRLHHYWHERALMGTIGQDSGASLRDGCKVVNQIGICEEELFPYEIHKFTKTPTIEMNENAQKYKITSYERAESLYEIKHAIANGKVVVIGMEVYESMETDEVAENGNLPIPAKGEKCLGGHAVLAVGYYNSEIELSWFEKIFRKVLRMPVSEGFLEIKNSWGEDWGDDGHFKMPYEYYEKYGMDAWILTLEK